MKQEDGKSKLTMVVIEEESNAGSNAESEKITEKEEVETFRLERKDAANTEDGTQSGNHHPATLRRTVTPSGQPPSLRTATSFGDVEKEELLKWMKTTSNSSHSSQRSKKSAKVC